MISLKTIQGNGGVSDAVNYHDKAFANDGRAHSDNYYANEQARATWGGAGAVMLGISGQTVTRDAFADALCGKLINPLSGEIQDLGKGVKDRRHGYDLTTSPSKSVSVMALVGGDERIIEAHREATAAAMQWLEKYAAIARVRNQGKVERINTGNLLYATVIHHTNRTEEPQLHSHNVVMSATYDVRNKQWRSLTNDQIMQLRRAADRVYQHTLSAKLKDLGYQLEYNNNSFEIAGFSREHLAAFSKRSAAIDDKLREWGVDPENASYEQRQSATLATRQAKQESTMEVLREHWEHEAQSIGLDLLAVRQSADRAASQMLERSQESCEEEAGKAVAWAAEHLSEREQAFARLELSETALKFLRGKTVSVDALEVAIDRYLKRGILVQHEESELLTTHRAKTAEQTLACVITEGKGKGRTILSSMAEFDDAVGAFEQKKSEAIGKPFKLTHEQVAAAQNLLLHPDQVQGIQGDAGTGKTAALEFVRGLAEARGWRVQGMATSASAAKELGASSGIQSETVAMFQAKNTEQIARLTAKIADLKTAIARDYVLASGTNRIDQHRLDDQDCLYAKSSGRKALYTFDHQRGDVYKTADTLRNAVGLYLLNLSKDAKPAQIASALRKEVASRWSGILSKMDVLARKTAGNLGNRLVSYQPVGLTEAVNARAALAAKGVTYSDLVTSLNRTEAELVNIRRTGNIYGAPTLLIMDEASLTSASDMARVASFGASFGARMVLQGDTKQHESVAAGRTFWQAQHLGMNTSYLVETRRFDHATPQTKESLARIGEQRFAEAVAALDRVEVGSSKLAETVSLLYVQSLKELSDRGVENPSVGVVALTNRDRKSINEEIHQALQKDGKVSVQDFLKQHLDDPKLTAAEQRFVEILRGYRVDALIFSKTYKEISVQKGDLVRVISLDVANNKITAETEQGKRIVFDPQRQDWFKPYVMERRVYSTGDSIQARTVIKLNEAQQPAGLKKIANGSRGIIVSIDMDKAVIEWKEPGKPRTTLTNEQLRWIDHAYARTSYIAQGGTSHRELFAVSEVGARIVDRQAIYVALSRAKDNTVLITSDFKTLVKNAGEYRPKTMALGETELQVAREAITERVAFKRSIRQTQHVDSERELKFPEATLSIEKTHPELQR